MSLAADIKNDIASLRARCDEFGECLDALKAILPQGERAAQIFTNARMTLGFVRTEIMQLETSLSVIRQTTPQIEKRAASRPPPAIDRKSAAAGERDDDQAELALVEERRPE